MVGGNANADSRVGGAIAHEHAVAGGVIVFRDQHARVKRRGLPRIVLVLAGTRGSRGRGIDVEVLAVDDLGRDRDRSASLDHFDLEGHEREVAVGEAHHAARAHAHLGAARGAPQKIAAQNALAEVDPALVFEEVARGDVERFIVDVQLDDGRIGRVHDGLPGLREAERVLRVLDGPGFVEPVEERAVTCDVAALLGRAAHAEIAVRGRENRFEEAELCAGARLDELPLIHGQVHPVHGVGGDFMDAHASSLRSSTTMVAPASASASWPTPRLTPMTAPKLPAAPACTPLVASSSTTAFSAGTPTSFAP